MKLPLRKILTTAIVAGLTLPAISHATNGFFLIGYGATSRAMGGVGVAKGQDGLAAAFNPATMADVADTLNEETNYRFDIGGDFFKSKAAVFHDENTLLTPTAVNQELGAPDTAFSQGGVYLLPAMGFVSRIDSQLSWGFAMAGSGAAALYDQTLPAGDSSHFFNFNGLAGDKLEIRLMNLQMLPSIAYKIDDNNTIGATLVMSFQLFKASGLGAFEKLGFGATAGNLSDMGTDTSWGGGIRLGWKGKFMEDKLHVGFNYSSRTYMDEFDKYKNLFAEQGDFDIPSNYAIGFAYDFTPEITGYLDVQKINFSEVASVGNKGPNITGGFFPCGGMDCGALGQDEGLGFGWDDQTVIKLGVSWNYTPELTLRAGFNHADNQIPDDQVLFNMLAPAVVEDHLTFGASYQLNPAMELAVSYVHAFANTITGPSPFQPVGADPANALDNVSLAMEQNSIGATFGIKF
ncbi:MAG: outer membrane protein transport protein [Gammaproteobacteria bacterium]|nr:outer membrane protein transport protein [Gammaproteobacteria bacterium]